MFRTAPHANGFRTQSKNNFQYILPRNNCRWGEETSLRTHFVRETRLPNSIWQTWRSAGAARTPMWWKGGRRKTFEEKIHRSQIGYVNERGRGIWLIYVCVSECVYVCTVGRGNVIQWGISLYQAITRFMINWQIYIFVFPSATIAVLRKSERRDRKQFAVKILKRTI